MKFAYPFIVDPAVKQALKNYKAPAPHELTSFGKLAVPLMFHARFETGKWGPLTLLPYGPISLTPTAKVFHYAQEIFEGMKAYKSGGLGPFLFRPDQNAKRFNASAVRMSMPEVPEEMFLTACYELTAHVAQWIPDGIGQSLYLRPFMMGTEENLGIKPSARTDFYVIGCLVGNYLTKDDPIKVLIQRKWARAFPGGTGFAKTGGNYSASLISAQETEKLGLDQTLWLDGMERENVEELSGMNFFAVINNELITPKLTDTILPGVTRSSLLQLAQDHGLKVKEATLPIKLVTEGIEDGTCTEAFACGTAAVILPIGSLHDLTAGQHKTYAFAKAPGKLSLDLKSKLLALQEGRVPDTHGWRLTVPPRPAQP